MKILLVDNDQEYRAFFHDAVRAFRKTIEVAFAADCDEALFKIKSQRLPEIIFLEWAQPTTGGRECLRTMRTNPLLTNIPIVMCLQFKDSAIEMECSAMGANRFIIKNDSLISLIDSLRPFIG